MSVRMAIYRYTAHVRCTRSRAGIPLLRLLYFSTKIYKANFVGCLDF